MNNQDFGKFISALRKEKGLTQIDLAEKIHVSDKAVSRWENGKNYPDIEILESLGSELGVSVNELIACKRIETPGQAEVETAKAYYEEKNRSRRLKNKIIALVCVLSVIILVIFLPTSTTLHLDGTREYQSLTYRIVKWNRFLNDENSYTKTSVYFMTNIQKDIEQLWRKEKINIYHKDLYFEDIKASSVNIGAEMPQIVYMNHDIVAFYGTCGLIVYDYQNKTLQNRISQAFLSRLGFNLRYAVTDADNGKIFILSREDLEDDAHPIEFDIESNMIRRIDELPFIENYGNKEETDNNTRVKYVKQGYLISHYCYSYDGKTAFLIADPNWDMATLKLVIEQNGNKTEYELFKCDNLI